MFSASQHDATVGSASLRQQRARRQRPPRRRWPLVLAGAQLLCLAALLWRAPAVAADQAAEYRLKAAFLYNFTTYTDWPPAVGSTMAICVYGRSPFGAELTALNGKRSGGRVIAVQQIAEGATLLQCQVVFVAASAIAHLPDVLNAVRGRAVLTMADSPGAAELGTMFNMFALQDRIRFEVNLRAARAEGLRIDPKLLRLAVQVFQ